MCHLFRRGPSKFLLNSFNYFNMPKPLYKTSASKLKKSSAKSRIPPRPLKFTLPDAGSKKFEILPKPIKSDSDEKEYRVIRLENGLQALLISDMHSFRTEFSAACGDDMSDDSEEYEDETSEEDEECSEEEEEFSEEEESEIDEEDEEGRGARLGAEENSEEKMAACALCVGVGSYSDPPHVQGLAHFVEHMLFMGSTKYPQENDFDSFIKKKGGSDNASTDCEMTTFYFEIPEEHLAEAMDKFTQFFVSPLMKQEAMEREREAIQSEFALGLPVDSNRRDQLLSKFLPEGHPGRTFMWGDERSLSAPHGPKDPELHREAHEFWKRHYSAHRMTVAVQARLPLSILEKYVANIFAQIPTNNKPSDNFTKFQFNEQTVTKDFHSLYYVKPIKNKSELHLTWCMKSFLSEYKSKPHQYVSWILGHEGAGSLLSYLKKKVWALGIFTGNSESGIDHTSVNCYFTITLILTKEGFLNIDKVIESVFSYMKLLKKDCPNERIYREIKDEEDINFKFEKEEEPSDNVEGLAENMQLYPPEHYITGEDLYYEFNPELITYVLESMQASKVNIMIFSQDHDPPIQYTDTEFWFGTKYKRQDIPKETVELWENIEPFPDFHLPEPNIFIANDFSLIPLPNELAEALAVVEKDKKENQEKIEQVIEAMADKSLKKTGLKKSPTKTAKKAKQLKKNDDSCEKYDSENKGDYTEDVEKKKLALNVIKKYYDAVPELLRNDSHLELWYKPDYKFKLPNAIICLQFVSALSDKTIKLGCMMDLWCHAMSQYLMERLYPATMAGLSYNIMPTHTGISIRFNGFSQKLLVLVDVITKAIAEYTNHLTEKWFLAIKDQQAKDYSNEILKPSKLSKLVRFALLLHHSPNALDKLSVLNEIQYSEMESFAQDFTKKMKVKVLVQGNMSKEQALDVARTIQSNILWEELKEEDRPKVLVLEIPPGRTFCKVRSMNNQSVNSNITNYYQWGDYSLNKTVILELIMLLMEEPVFDQLRTKEQLGYSVFSMLRYTYGVLGFSVTVNSQANKYSADHVDDRINAFLQSFKEDLTKLTEKTFRQTKAALIKQKLCADVTLKEETMRNWSEITSMEYNFERLQQEVECIKTISIDDVKQYFDDHYDRQNNDKFRMLSIQVIGNSQPEKTEEKEENLTKMDHVDLTFIDDEDPSKKFVYDIKKFKQDLRIFPEICVHPPAV